MTLSTESPTPASFTLSIRQALLLGFGIILTLFAGTAIYVHYESVKVAKIEHRLLDVRNPTVLASTQILNGVNTSLAGLRGYMILGGSPEKAKKFQEERLAGWAIIDSALDKYDELSQNWTDSKNIKRLESMRLALAEFRLAQQEVEDISHTRPNIPSLQLLFTDAVPKALKITASITALINEENTLEATPERKRLLKLLADSRGSFVGGLANIRAFLLSGKADFRKQFDQQWAVNNERFTQINSQISLFSSAQKNAWKEYTQQRAKFSPLPKKIMDLRVQPDWNKANYWLGTKAAPKAAEVRILLSELIASQNKLAIIDQEELYNEQARLDYITSSASIVSIIGGIFIAIFLSNTIASQLTAIAQYARNMSKGELNSPDIKTRHINELKTLGHAMNTTKNDLHTLISDISSCSHYLSTHTNQLQDKIKSTHNISNVQQQQTDIIVTSMNEMNNTVGDIAHNTTEAASSAEAADTATSNGLKVVEETVSSINALAGAIGQAAETINQLGEETNDVDTILASISGIADQTNLLALNAAIEAARAGEQGRGFAVVADEVRTLAARTQESTIEIRSMLDKLKSGANNAVEVMGAGHKQAQSSVEKANTAKDKLATITQTVNTIKDMNTQIATAAEQQSAVSHEITQSISTVNLGAKNAEKDAAHCLQSVEEMVSIAKQLEDGVNRFTLESK